MVCIRLDSRRAATFCSSGDSIGTSATGLGSLLIACCASSGAGTAASLTGLGADSREYSTPKRFAIALLVFSMTLAVLGSLKYFSEVSLQASRMTDGVRSCHGVSSHLGVFRR